MAIRNLLAFAWLLGHDLFWASIWIASGIIVITFIQLLIFPGLLVPLGLLLSFPSLNIQPGDWNTARSVWLVEVPLAFLLRRVLQGGVENVQRRTNHTQNLAETFELNAVKGVQHLRYRVVEPSFRPWHPNGQGYIVNTHTGKGFLCDIALDDAAQGLRLPRTNFHTRKDRDTNPEDAKLSIKYIERPPNIEDLMPNPKKTAPTATEP
jgi:hypothetical protein